MWCPPSSACLIWILWLTVSSWWLMDRLVLGILYRVGRGCLHPQVEVMIRWKHYCANRSWMPWHSAYIQWCTNNLCLENHEVDFLEITVDFCSISHWKSGWYTYKFAIGAQYALADILSMHQVQVIGQSVLSPVLLSAVHADSREISWQYPSGGFWNRLSNTKQLVYSVTPHNNELENGKRIFE